VDTRDCCVLDLEIGRRVMRHRLLPFAVLCLVSLWRLGESESAASGWPSAVEEITYASSADGSTQRAMFYAPSTPGPKPLLVALHTWGGDYAQVTHAPFATLCIEYGWVLIHPDCRGPHDRPESTGSELVIGDILSAVEYATRHAPVDADRIYLVGASGGGYTSLLAAGRAPDIWAGVSSWVPITDLKAWYLECRDKAGMGQYASDIVASCGGAPVANSAAERECRKRSPLTHLRRAARVPIDINAGIHDGHDGPVSVSHSLLAFNELAARRDRITKRDIAYIVAERKIPAHLRSGGVHPAYGTKRILFRRTSNRARITIFDGGHEIDFEAALSWLSSQRKAPAASN
jgi:dipeptidyl aminopeptidase/acylaminoacyl peptidase